LATASDDGTAKVWDGSTGRELLILPGNKGSVLSIEWSADGSKLATASKDETTRVWDASTGHELLALRGHQGPVLSVAWSPDGKRLASAGDDKIVQVYAVDLVELLRLVRSRITRELTPDECRLYFNTDRCPRLPEVP
jgi:WD40 repeat protein